MFNDIFRVGETSGGLDLNRQPSPVEVGDLRRVHFTNSYSKSIERVFLLLNIIDVTKYVDYVQQQEDSLN